MVCRNLIVGSMQRGQELTISLLEERRLSLDIYALLLSSGHAWRARYSDLYNSLCKCVYGSMVECAVLLGDGSHLALGIKSGSVQHRAIQHQVSYFVFMYVLVHLLFLINGFYFGRNSTLLINLVDRIQNL